AGLRQGDEGDAAAVRVGPAGDARLRDADAGGAAAGGGGGAGSSSGGRGGAGGRFTQGQQGGGGAGVWDAHGGLKANHTKNCLAIDQPIAGLLTDLKRRGMLKETLVVFATEFGRTPGTQGSDGRDHHIYGFSVWLAGGGIKGGIVHGATDELGFHAVEQRHYVTDVHATILHLLGLDSRQLEIPGRKRLEIDH